MNVRKISDRFPRISIQKRSKIVKNERAHYTLGAHYRSENTVYVHVYNAHSYMPTTSNLDVFDPKESRPCGMY
jgi:hypothetical protein